MRPAAPVSRHTWVCLGLIVLLAVAFRVHRLDVPMERDEGEYAYIAQQMLRGVPPYASAYSMKLPGVYVVYSGFLSLLGETPAAVRTGLLLFNAATIGVVFLLGRRLLDDTAGLAAALAFAVFSIHPAFTGLFANTEAFLILPAAAATLLLLSATHRSGMWRFAAAGLLMGGAFVIKQHAVAFVLFGGAWTIISSITLGMSFVRQAFTRTLAYALAVATPFALVCVWMWYAGVFEPFRFWTFTYAQRYVAMEPWDAGLEHLTQQIEKMGGPLRGLWLLALVGLLAGICVRRVRHRWLFICLFTLASVAAVCPGLLFRDHYFIQLLPAASLLIGLGVSALASTGGTTLRRARQGFAVAILVAAAAWPIVARWDYFVTMTDDQVARASFGGNPFPEAVRIADYLRKNARPGDTLAVLGSEPQIHFYSRIPGVTPYIYIYPMMEPHPFALRMQREMISQIESAEPRYIVMVFVPWSWFVRENSHPDLLAWSHRYLERHYDRVGLVEWRLPGQTDYYWDSDVPQTPPLGGQWITVHRRR